jgi:hypothetical protein
MVDHLQRASAPRWRQQKSTVRRQLIPETSFCAALDLASRSVSGRDHLDAELLASDHRHADTLVE